MTSSLSVGLMVFSLLNGSEIAKKVTKIFPVVTDNATLPYIAYRRTGLSRSVVKAGGGADTVIVEVGCFAATYAESLTLAEDVRELLDGRQGTIGIGDESLVMRSCTLTGCEESYESDAFVQTLTFEVKINNY